MFSDDASEQNMVITMDYQGNQVAETVIDSDDLEHVFESLDWIADPDPANTGTLYTLSAEEGSKVLYRINDGEITTQILSGDYDELIISGMAVAETGDTLYFVTEEWQEETLNAGLLVQYDLINNAEIARYSIVVEDDGNLQGVRDPSGVAVNAEQSRRYITSDVDDALLYVFEIN